MWNNVIYLFLFLEEIFHIFKRESSRDGTERERLQFYDGWGIQLKH
jgi:putative heme degradation protein